MKYIPSPIEVSFKVMYQAIANNSGRMQYYRKEAGKGRSRIGRQDFIYAYNHLDIIALNPVQVNKSKSIFQMEFYVRHIN